MAYSKPALALRTKACRVLFEQWLEARGTALHPKRADIGPMALREILSQVAIIEVLAPGTAIVRLAGTAYRDMFGLELTGRNLVDLSTGELGRQGAYRNFVSAHHPCGRHAEVSFVYSSGSEDTFEYLSLPLAAGRSGGSPLLLVAMESLLGRRWENAVVPYIVASPGDFTRFVDIGAGVPATIDPPAAFTTSATTPPSGML